MPQPPTLCGLTSPKSSCQQIFLNLPVAFPSLDILVPQVLCRILPLSLWYHLPTHLYVFILSGDCLQLIFSMAVPLLLWACKLFTHGWPPNACYTDFSPELRILQTSVLSASSQKNSNPTNSKLNLFFQVLHPSCIIKSLLDLFICSHVPMCLSVGTSHSQCYA